MLTIFITVCILLSIPVWSSSFAVAENDFANSNTITYLTPIEHVVIILMENKEYSDVIGSTSAPYENALADNYSLATQYYAAAHPSLPNYLALVGGSTFGVTSDCLPIECMQNSTNITDLIMEHGYSWKEYAESMQSNCSQRASYDGLYVPKHNPFIYFHDITGNDGTGTTSSGCDSHVVPFAQFANDLRLGNLPNYAFITPNVCDDAHDCSLATADNWLSVQVPQIINSRLFSSTAIFIVYDEGTTNLGFSNVGGGHVACIIVSPFAKTHFKSSVQYSHYSLLATVESIFGLGNLARSDSSSNNMQDLFTISLLSEHSITTSVSSIMTSTNILSETSSIPKYAGDYAIELLLFVGTAFVVVLVPFFVISRRK